MKIDPVVSLGDIVSAATFLTAAVALLLTLYQLRRDATRKRTEFTVTALIAQLHTLTAIHGMSDERRSTAWDAIASAPGGPGLGSPIENAIAIQIQFLDRIGQGEEITSIPTYPSGQNSVHT